MIDHDLLTIAYGIADALPTSGSEADAARIEAIGAALRRGWDSAAPTATEPASTPGSGYAVEHALREEVARLERRLQETMERVKAADEIEAARDRLRRVLAVEAGDRSAAPDGWFARYGSWFRDDAFSFDAPVGSCAGLVQYRHGMGWSWVVDLKTDDPMRISPDAGEWEWIDIAHGTAPTALEAMEAADAAIRRGVE